MKGKMKKILQRILIISFILLFVLSNLLYLKCKNNVTMGITIISIIIYSLVLIPSVFCNSLSSSNQSKMKICYYHCLHLIYVFLPIALVGQVVKQRQLMVVITQVISIISLVILYVRCKHLIKKHLDYLRYSNVFISGVFLFVITLICLFKDSLNTVFTFLFLLPLVGLQILYEKVGVSIGEKKKIEQNTVQDISGADDGAKKGD